MTQPTPRTDADRRPGTVVTATRPRFFLVLSIVLLIVVVLGFAPTAYLAPLFETPATEGPMPLHLIVHAVVMTMWYVGLVGQTSLIVGRRLKTHQRIGVLMAVIGASIVITGLTATMQVIPRAAARGFPPRDRIETLVMSNTLNLLVFGVLVTWALLKRTRPQLHRRLMLIASIAIIGPAVGPGRMFGAFLQSVLPGFVTVPVPLIFWILLIVPLVVYDLVRLARVHPATIWGGGAKAVAVALTLILVETGGATSWANWLEAL